MYYIKPQNGEGFFSKTVNYIKVNPVSGCNIACSKQEAQGVVAKGITYTINAESPIPETEAASCFFATEWDDEIQMKYEEMMLEQIIQETIDRTKTDLALYLETHPLTWVDGKQYSVTQEKQNILLGNIAAYQIESQANPQAEITWNATGEVCTVWDYENLCALAVAIKNYVKPFISYQQTKEVEIAKCKTLEEIAEIVVNYDEVLEGEAVGES